MTERRTWWRIPLILLFVLIVGAGVIHVCKGLWIKMLLNRAWEQEQMVFKIHMEMPEQMDGISVSWDDMADQRYFTVDLGTEQVYLHSRNLYFSNGTGYALDGLLEELGVPENLLRNLPFLISPDRYFDGGYDAWEFQLPEEPGWLIKKMMPEAVQYWDQLQALRFVLYEEAGWLRYILICHENLYLYIELSDVEPKPIPTETLMQMGTKPLPDIRTLEPLVRACLDLNTRGTILADVTIQVECGPLPIQDTGKIRFSEEGLYFGRGDQWTELTPDSLERDDLLLGLCWMLIRDGAWEPKGTDSGIFNLTIPAEDLSTGLMSIIPELDGLDFTLNDGTITIHIEHNQLTGMELVSTGQMPFLIATIPLSIQIGLTVTG